MILHLGGEFCCFFEDVLFVLRADGCEKNAQTQRFLQAAEDNGTLIVIDPTLVKSYVVTSTPQGNEHVYASPISAATAAKAGGESSREVK